ncbi:hypothetical protein APHAL10511_003995 [Amanita phalloides]|nr:hypothetical protein APHAL10511_003995 [Amanita phalloides]
MSVRPPKGSGRKKAGAGSDGSATPHLPSLAEQLSYMHLARPFKNPNYTKNVNRRAKNLKAIISQEREREKADRELRRLFRQGKVDAQTPPTAPNTFKTTTTAVVEKRQQGGDAMDVDAGAKVVVKSEAAIGAPRQAGVVEDGAEEIPTYTSIEAPPSIWPPKHYCDITGLEAPYTDPATGLRFHDKSIYELIKGLSTSTAKEYLSARGVSTVVK